MDQERRKSYRCQVQPTQEAAILRTQKTDVIVRIVEESAGGLGVTTAQTGCVKEGQVLSLATGAGCCEVKVVHVNESDSQTRIGLQRIRELAFLSCGAPRLWPSTRHGIADGSRSFQLMLICAACLAFFLGGVLLPSGWWRKGEPARSTQKNRSQREKELATHFVQLDGLKSQRIIETLKLDEQQQLQISVIVEDATAKLAALFDQRQSLSTRDWSEMGLQLIQAAWIEIQAVLTEEQQDRWRDLFAEKAAERKGAKNQTAQPAGEPTALKPISKPAELSPRS